MANNFSFKNYINHLVNWRRNRSKLKDTKQLFTVDGKMYTTERHNMHREIVEKIVRASTTAGKWEKPLAILIGGGTAAGKTTLRKAIIEDELVKRKIYAATIDPDDMKEFIPEYAVYKKKYPKHAAQLVHKESCDIGALLLKKLIRHRKHLIYEGTMVKMQKYERLVSRLYKNGYEIHAYVVDVPLAVAKERERERARSTGRKVPEAVIENTHKLVPRTVEKIKDLVNCFQIYDNQNGLVLIASNDFVDSARYKEFLAKGNVAYYERLMPHVSASKRMYNLSEGHLRSMDSWIAQQKMQKRSANLFVDDCNGEEMLDREYPNKD